MTTEWISVEERLPEMEQEVLVWAADSREMVTCKRVQGLTEVVWIENYGDNWYTYAVTHWMPLPEPPEEEDLQ